MTAELWFPFLHLFRRASIHDLKYITVPDAVAVMALRASGTVIYLSQLPLRRSLPFYCHLPSWVIDLHGAIHCHYRYGQK